MAAATKVRTVTPIIKVTAPRPLAKPKRARRRSRTTGGTRDLTGVAIGSAIFGWIEGSDLGARLPTIPVLGRKGSLALISYFIAKQTRNKIMWDVTYAAVALSAYQLAKEGRITGDDDDDDDDNDDE